jgi:hypothetical protein
MCVGCKKSLSKSAKKQGNLLSLLIVVVVWEKMDLIFSKGVGGVKHGELRVDCMGRHF